LSLASQLVRSGCETTWYYFSLSRSTILVDVILRCSDLRTRSDWQRQNWNEWSLCNGEGRKDNEAHEDGATRSQSSLERKVLLV